MTKKKFDTQPIADIMDSSIKRLEGLKKINFDSIKDLRIKEAMILFNSNSEKKIKQKELARLVFSGENVTDKVAEENMSAWCNGKRFSLIKPRHIKRIANILNVSTDYLLNNN